MNVTQIKNIGNGCDGALTKTMGNIINVEISSKTYRIVFKRFSPTELQKQCNTFVRYSTHCRYTKAKLSRVLWQFDFKNPKIVHSF